MPRPRRRSFLQPWEERQFQPGPLLPQQNPTWAQSRRNGVYQKDTKWLTESTERENRPVKWAGTQGGWQLGLSPSRPSSQKLTEALAGEDTGR